MSERKRMAGFVVFFLILESIFWVALSIFTLDPVIPIVGFGPDLARDTNPIHR